MRRKPISHAESEHTRNQVIRPLDSAALRPLSALRFVAAWLGREVSALDPGCFALVMATGIISNGFFLQGERTIADVLFAINLVVYPCLWLLTILRAVRFHAAIRTDLLNPRRIFLFFTAVAATSVLGTAIGLRGFPTVALAMWLLALVLWFALIYLSFGVLAFLNTADGADVVEGAWLNAIVGTQSVVILGALFASPVANAAALTAILLHMLWMLGLVLYAIFVTLLAYRIFFVALEPGDVTPPLWIVMGAAAISVNAGSLLVPGGGTPFLHAIEPFLDGVTLALWAWATWWIPLLVLLGIWKHVIHGVPIAYSTQLWSIVFPLGMYTVATLRLSPHNGCPDNGVMVADHGVDRVCRLGGHLHRPDRGVGAQRPEHAPVSAMVPPSKLDDSPITFPVRNRIRIPCDQWSRIREPPHP